MLTLYQRHLILNLHTLHFTFLLFSLTQILLIEELLTTLFMCLTLRPPYLRLGRLHVQQRRLLELLPAPFHRTFGRSHLSIVSNCLHKLVVFLIDDREKGLLEAQDLWETGLLSGAAAALRLPTKKDCLSEGEVGECWVL